MLLGTNWLLLLFRSLIGFDIGVARGFGPVSHSRFVGALSGCYQARRLCFRESWSFARSLFCTFTYLLSIFTSLSDASNMM